MLAACTLGGCMTQRGIPAAGTVVETRVVTTVDTQLAKSYLETSFAQGTTRPKLYEHYAPNSIRGRCLGSFFVT